jgi:(2Fe-2S) ferredoxin
MDKGSEDLRAQLKVRVAGLDPTIRVSKAGCLGRCSDGAIVVIMPDNVWLKRVTMDDIDDVVKLIVT